MIRARIQRKGKKYSLGEYQTQKEVDAAKAAASRVLDRVEVDTPPPAPPAPAPRFVLPSLPDILRMTNMGRYDSHPKGLQEAASVFARRFKMVKSGNTAATPAVWRNSQEDIKGLLAIG